MTDTHVDYKALSELREVMEDGYPELLDTFLSDSKVRLGELQKAVDAKALSDVAHSFKGSASNMGATHLAGLCQKLESDANNKSPDEIAQLIAEIGNEFADIRPVYEDERQHATTH
ncbi:Hpt domain-containing protein [Pseudomonas sp. TH06]|uniref:Hpt domain-containing protein n=1 Tax=Pseudomonas sp. TH06 TaxID=2796372 RepID=UPI001911ECF8|nr:Hpt domain-containing protein [Pseudomonas sp. TH06]